MKRSYPPSFEWVKDVNEKADDAWIAVRKKLSTGLGFLG